MRSTSSPRWHATLAAHPPTLSGSWSASVSPLRASRAGLAYAYCPTGVVTSCATPGRQAAPSLACCGWAWQARRQLRARWVGACRPVTLLGDHPRKRQARAQHARAGGLACRNEPMSFLTGHTKSSWRSKKGRISATGPLQAGGARGGAGHQAWVPWAAHGHGQHAERGHTPEHVAAGVCVEGEAAGRAGLPSPRSLVHDMPVGKQKHLIKQVHHLQRGGGPGQGGSEVRQPSRSLPSRRAVGAFRGAGLAAHLDRNWHMLPTPPGALPAGGLAQPRPTSGAGCSREMTVVRPMACAEATKERITL